MHKYNVCACVRVSVIANTSHFINDAVCVCFICQWWWATSGSILKMQQRLWTHKSHPPIHPPNKQTQLVSTENNSSCLRFGVLLLLFWCRKSCLKWITPFWIIYQQTAGLPSQAKQVMFEHPASAYSLYLFRIPRALPDFGKTAFSCSFDIFENNICVTQRTQHGLPIS